MRKYHDNGVDAIIVSTLAELGDKASWSIKTIVERVQAKDYSYSSSTIYLALTKLCNRNVIKRGSNRGYYWLPVKDV